jgi:hypothetical protein
LVHLADAYIPLEFDQHLVGNVTYAIHVIAVVSYLIFQVVLLKFFSFTQIRLLTRERKYTGGANQAKYNGN